MGFLSASSPAFLKSSFELKGLKISFASTKNIVTNS